MTIEEKLRFEIYEWEERVRAHRYAFLQSVGGAFASDEEALASASKFNRDLWAGLEEKKS